MNKFKGMFIDSKRCKFEIKFFMYFPKNIETFEFEIEGL